MIVIPIIVAMVAVISLYFGIMKEKENILYLSFLTIVFLFILIISMRLSYRQGQIDALTNNVKFRLEVQSDSTKVWKEIE